MRLMYSQQSHDLGKEIMMFIFGIIAGTKVYSNVSMLIFNFE